MSPIEGWRGPGGTVVFNRKAAWTDRPITIACGQCWGCRLEKSRQWAQRCVHEAEMNEKNTFITLTYDEEHLPPGGTLVLEDWQKFAKRLRKKIGRFRFYHCGEYGDKRGRPHYHAILFGVDFNDDRRFLENRNGNNLYSSETLERVWGMGQCVVGDVSFESAAYVARYVMKKIQFKGDEAAYLRLDYVTGECWTIKKEYATMSRGGTGGEGGIGKRWIEKWMDDVYPRDVVYSRGKVSRPPRFYDGQFEVKDSGGMEKVKGRRVIEGRKISEEERGWERLRVKEKVAIARGQVFARDVD